MDDRSGVAVVGSINADLAAFGSPLPRPGETVIGSEFSLVLGGKGANQADRRRTRGRAYVHDRRRGRGHCSATLRWRARRRGCRRQAVRIMDGVDRDRPYPRRCALTAQNDIMIIPNANAPAELQTMSRPRSEHCVIRFRSSWCNWRFHSPSWNG